MNWIEEYLRPWIAENADYTGPVPPLYAPNRWVRDIYNPWRAKQPADSSAPVAPW